MNAQYNFTEGSTGWEINGDGAYTGFGFHLIANNSKLSSVGGLIRRLTIGDASGPAKTYRLLIQNTNLNTGLNEEYKADHPIAIRLNWTKYTAPADYQSTRRTFADGIHIIDTGNNHLSQIFHQINANGENRLILRVFDDSNNDVGYYGSFSIAKPHTEGDSRSTSYITWSGIVRNTIQPYSSFFSSDIPEWEANKAYTRGKQVKVTVDNTTKYYQCIIPAPALSQFYSCYWEEIENFNLGTASAQWGNLYLNNNSYIKDSRINLTLAQTNSTDVNGVPSGSYSHYYYVIDNNGKGLVRFGGAAFSNSSSGDVKLYLQARNYSSTWQDFKGLTITRTKNDITSGEFDGNFTITGAATCDSTLTITGTTTCNGNLIANGTVSCTSTLTITGTTTCNGALVTNSTTTCNGAVTINNTTTCKNTLTINMTNPKLVLDGSSTDWTIENTSSEFVISSNATNTAKFKGAQVNGFSIQPRLYINTAVSNTYNLYVNGTSYFSGNTTIGGTLTVSGNSSFAAFTASGAATLSDTLTVSGLSTLASLTVTGATTLNTLSITGSTTHAGHIYLTGTTGSSSTNTTQICFQRIVSGTASDVVAISAIYNNTNGNALIINKSTSVTTGNIVLRPDGPSAFQAGTGTNTTLTINASAQSTYTFKVGGTTCITGVTSITNTTDLSATYGYDSGALIVSGGAGFAKAIAVNANIYTHGSTGWYNATYTGGIFMQDTTYIRTNENKQLLVSRNVNATDTVNSSQLIISGLSSTANVANNRLGNSNGKSAALELWSGNLASWQIINDTDGYFHIRNNYNSGSTPKGTATYYQDSVKIDPGTGNTAISGVLTLDFTARSIADGVSTNAMAIVYNNSLTGDNQVTHTTYPIRFIGTEAGATASCICFGSTSGDTWLGAGESSNKLPLYAGSYKTEALFLSSDTSISFYTNANTVASNAHVENTNYKRTFYLNDGIAKIGNTGLPGTLQIQSSYATAPETEYVANITATELAGNRTWNLPAVAGNRTFIGTPTNGFPYTANSVFYAGGTTYASTIRSKNGALYATDTDGSLSWGTLPVAQGGTGVTAIADIQAGKDGEGDTIASKYVRGVTSSTSGRLVGFRFTTSNNHHANQSAYNGHEFTLYAYTDKLVLYDSTESTAVKIWNSDELYVNLSGDTMSGDLFVTKASDTSDSISIGVKRTGYASCRLFVNQAGTNQGIYSDGYYNATTGAYEADGQWLIWRNNSTNAVHLPGHRVSGVIYPYRTTTGSWIIFWANETDVGKINLNKIGTAGTEGFTYLYLGNNKTSSEANNATGRIYLYNSNGGSSTLTGSYGALGGTNYNYITAGRISATALWGAVWNDYAECRNAETTEGGYCVTETAAGKMIKTTKRLQAGCKVTSDTYGNCMGQTKTANTPIAVSGRVLVYPYQAREKYELGAAVCSAPNGTVDIMSRDEIMMYPERIVGTVSEIPDYEIWHGGRQDGEDDVKVNGRIWIYVR